MIAESKYANDVFRFQIPIQTIIWLTIQLGSSPLESVFPAFFAC